MIDAIICRKSFIHYFSDAILFVEEANTMKISSGRQQILKKSYIRASIFNSALALEAAANCCLLALPLDNLIYNDFERLSTIPKFDIFLQFRKPRRLIDRNHMLVKPIMNLISCRNKYVHSKIIQEPLDKGKPKVHYWEPLGLPQNIEYWDTVHALKIVSVLSDFLNYFFFDLCEYSYEGYKDRTRVRSILSTAIVPMKKGDTLPGNTEYSIIDEDSAWLILPFKSKYDLEFAFLGFITTGSEDKQKYPKRKWGDYSFCDTSKYKIPIKPFSYRGANGEIVIQNFPPPQE